MKKSIFVLTILVSLLQSVLVTLNAQEEDAIPTMERDSESTDYWRNADLKPITPIHEANGYGGGSGKFDHNDRFDYEEYDTAKTSINSLESEEIIADYIAYHQDTRSHQYHQNRQQHYNDSAYYGYSNQAYQKEYHQTYSQKSSQYFYP